MKTSLEDIIRPVADEFSAFQLLYTDVLASMSSSLFGMLDGYGRGKTLRPLLVILAAQACGDITEDTYRTAIAVELLHTATLLHDDVVDSADTRRGQPSLNAQCGNKAAVLVGDYLLAQAVTQLTQNKDKSIINDFLEASRHMGQGELTQMHNTMNDIDESAYIEVISNKTASLFSACCRAGAKSAGADKHTHDSLALYGFNLGIAFQMRDDMLDYGTDKIGKPLCHDLKEGKFTLPLIAHINTLDKKQQETLIDDVTKHQRLDDIAAEVRNGEGMRQTEIAIKRYTEEAMRCLSDIRNTNELKQLALFCAQREK